MESQTVVRRTRPNEVVHWDGPCRRPGTRRCRTRQTRGCRRVRCRAPSRGSRRRAWPPRTGPCRQTVRRFAPELRRTMKGSLRAREPDGRVEADRGDRTQRTELELLEEEEVACLVHLLSQAVRVHGPHPPDRADHAGVEPAGGRARADTTHDACDQSKVPPTPASHIDPLHNPGSHRRASRSRILPGR